MIHTKNIDVDGIPDTWIFEKYCNLNERLHGQDIRMKSLFTQERTASMFIYFKHGEYLYKDFSSGFVGDAINLVQKMFNLTYMDAVKKIRKDYESTDSPYEQVSLKQESKFKVTSHTKRQWNEYDAKYWGQFQISSAMLEKYNVFPLLTFTMSKDVDGKILEIPTSGQYIYGYFKADGTLAKIYRPKSKSLKFINVTRFIQGADQLEYNALNLIICSSMKDGLALNQLGLDAEFVAPNSENSMISKPNLVAYGLKYKNVYTLFDNDDAGHKSMEKYRKQYGIPSINLNLSKDIADSVRDYGLEVTRNCIKPFLNKS